MSSAQSVLDGYLTEARTLREVELPGLHAGPADLHLTLLEVRQRLDRVEHILAAVVRGRVAAQRAHTAATHTFDDCFDTALIDQAKGARPGDEYASAKQRHALAKFAAFDELHAQRAATDALSRFEEAVELLRLTHRGLDGTRQDLHALLRAVAFESHLER